VDEAHRNIYELRKEIKALKKEVAALQPKPTTRNRRSTKKTSPPDTDDTDAEQEA
jgi:hypothetical protein